MPRLSSPRIPDSCSNCLKGVGIQGLKLRKKAPIIPGKSKDLLKDEPGTLLLAALENAWLAGSVVLIGIRQSVWVEKEVT